MKQLYFVPILLLLSTVQVYAETNIPEEVLAAIKTEDTISSVLKTEVLSTVVNALDNGWCGSVNEELFVVQFLVLGQEKDEFRQKRNVQILTQEAEILAITRLLCTPEISTVFVAKRLDHPSTLFKSVQSVAWRLYLDSLKNMVHITVIQAKSHLIVVISGKSKDIRDFAEKPNVIDEVRFAYRDLLHRRSLIALQTAVEIFKSAQERDLASPSLYLDAAVAYAAIHQNSEAQKLVFEALEKYPNQPQEYKQRAAKILLLVGDEEQQIKAEKLLKD